MTTKIVADDVIVRWHRRFHDWDERVLKGSLDPEKVSREVQKMIDRGRGLLKLIASDIDIPRVGATTVSVCFTARYFQHRDPSFDVLFPKTVPGAGPGVASTFELTEALSFREMVEAYGITGSDAEIKEQLIKKEMVWDICQIDKLIGWCEEGMNPLRLRTDGLSNIFPVVCWGDVFAVNARRGPRGWRVDVLGFARAGRWHVEDRVSFRN